VPVDQRAHVAYAFFVTPCVEGYVTMMGRQALAVLLALTSEVLEDRPVPSVSAPTTTTRMPAMTAEAALVPCALDEMRQTFRPFSPRDR